MCSSDLIDKKNLRLRVACQRRLAISRLLVPNLDGFVITAARNLLSIGAPRHREDPEITKSQHTNQQKQRGKNLKKNLPTRVPGQRRLANSRLQVPNLDGCVTAAAGNLFSIGAPRHRKDPEIVRSQRHKSTETERETPGEKELEKKRACLSARSPSTCKKYVLESFTLLFFEICSSQKNYLFEWLFTPDTQTGT